MALRQDRMTVAERMHTLLAGKPIDRILFMPWLRGFCAKNVGYSLGEFYTDPEKSFWAQVWTHEQYGCDNDPQYGYAAIGAWEFGGEMKFPSTDYEQAPAIARFPVESEEDVWKLELPDVKTAGIVPQYMQFSKLQASLGMPVTISCQSPFYRASSLCGMERLCRWMIKKPEVVRRLLRLTTDFSIEMIQYWVDTFGAENISPRSSDIGNDIMSPKQFQEFALPYLIEVHEKMLAIGLKHIQCHICGDHNLLLPYWEQVPMGDPGIVTFDHQVDLSTAVKYFGDSCIIAGNIQSPIIQHGTPQQVYEHCKETIEKAKYAPRGYILMTECGFPPMAPPYNLYIMRKAVDDFGWYD